MRRPSVVATVVGILAVLALGCQGERFDEPMTLGGQTVSADLLNRGHAVYRQHCRSCHGEDGRGRVPGIVPPPRDFAAAVFKYTSVADGELPTDADLVRTIRRGLVDTPMQPFGLLSDADVLAVAQYVKTFGERWRSEVPGLPVTASDDPWAEGDLDEAVARGEDVYHGVGECVRCHPAYRPAEAVERWEPSRVIVGVEEFQVPGFREDLSRPVEVDTVFGRVLSPDFLDDRPRAGSTVRDLYRVVASGVGGTPMRGLHGRLPVDDRWAVVHYLDSLLVLRGTDDAEALREQLADRTALSPVEARRQGPSVGAPRDESAARMVSVAEARATRQR